MATTAPDASVDSTANPRYTRVAAWLHLLIAFAVVANIGLAMLTEDMAKDIHRAAMGIHKALGITILALAVVRIMWRLGHKPPPFPIATPNWQRWSAKLVHFLFYALLLLLPLSGWIWMSAAGRPISFFGLFELPMIAAADKSLADVMHERHEVMGFVMLGLVVLHLLAALKHQFVDRNGLIGRMNPLR